LADNELMYSFDFELPGEPAQLAPLRTMKPQDHGNYFFDPNSFTDNSTDDTAPACSAGAQFECFEPSLLGTLGTAKRTICCGPHISNTDFAILKTIPISENKHVDFRAEFFNIFNHTQFFTPDGNFVAEAQGSRFRDLDGNEYVDPNLCFGALMAGHCHPAVMKAVERRLSTGTMFGMPHNMEWELAEEICMRFPVEMVRFGSSGTEATMHAVRLARAATGRDKIVKFEGAYHGLHDSALVSVKPHAPDFGDIAAPTPVPGGLGVPKASVANVLIATFNDLSTVERKFRENPGEIAAIILEPILMNVGLCLPQPGFLEGLREIATNNCALLIFDEVKTGAKLGWGGASEYFGVIPDM